ncbi:MAG: thiamine-phosphate kinase [Terracidiphilus sp.]
MAAQRNRPKSAVPGELTLLARIRARAAQTAHPDLLLGIGDDCALLRPDPGDDVAITTDLSIAGRHFRLDWHPPESVGHRTLARGLSDLAAMGARPIAAFLSLGLPPTLVQREKGREPWIDRFLDGFLALARAHRTVLAGGDLAESPIPLADIVLTGSVPRGKALLRSGASSGDLLYVTGTLGASAAALARLSQLAQVFARSRSKAQASALPPIPARLKALLAPHLYPKPRIPQGLWLAEHSLATAAIDLSDGLSTDLAHICRESGVAAELDQASLPIYPDATLAQALHGGEEYELLFTAPPAASVPAAIEGVPVTRIGRVVAAAPDRPPVTLVTAKGAEPLPPQGWQHFS